MELNEKLQSFKLKKTDNNSNSLSQIQPTQKDNSDKFHAKQNFILENLLTI